MSKKGLICLLIAGIAIVNFIFAMEETSDCGMQKIAEERIAQSLNISASELKKLLSGSQGQDTASIMRKKYDNDWTLLMHMARGRFLCKEYSKELYSECKSKFYRKILPEIYLKIAKLFIKYDADINAKNNKNSTALMIAYNSKNEPIIKLLLESRNIAMNVQDKNGFTPLHYAIELGYDVIACKLIRRKAPFNTKTKFTSHWRAEKGYSWNTYSDDETPLMLAARRNFLSVVECLLDEGADPLLKNIVGQKAYAIATDDAVKEAIKRAELQKKAIETAGKQVLQVKIEAKKYLEDQQKLREEKALQVAKKSARQQEEKKRERQKLEQMRLRIIEEVVLKLEEEMFREGEEDKLRLKELKKLRVAKKLARQQEEKKRKRQKDTKEEELVPKRQSFGEKLKSAFYKFMSYFQ